MRAAASFGPEPVDLQVQALPGWRCDNCLSTVTLLVPTANSLAHTAYSSVQRRQRMADGPAMTRVCTSHRILVACQVRTGT